MNRAIKKNRSSSVPNHHWPGPCTRLLVLALLVSCSVALVSQARPNNAQKQKPILSNYAGAVKAGRDAVRELMSAAKIPGFSVAVGIHGQVVWSEAFGLADLEQSVATTTQTRFRLGSVSKVLTVAAVAKLYQEGKLDLDAPIQKYVPAFPDKGQPITTRQLAGHLSGIRHYQAKDYSQGRNIDLEHYDTILDSLKIFQDDPLVAPPGTRYSYTTFGYTLLSQIIERAAGQPFLTYLEEQIFRPLGMRNTAFDRVDKIIANRSRCYDYDRQAQVVNSAFVDPSYKWAGGGIVATAEDLVLFGTAFSKPGFLNAEVWQLMFTPQKTSDGKETIVGLGWRIAKDTQGRQLYHHAGNINGGRSVLMIYPESGLVIALLSNLGNTPPGIEQTAQILAEPFIEAIEQRPIEKAGAEMAGVYTYSLETPIKAAAGTLELTRTGADYLGSLTTPKPCADFSRNAGLPVLEKLNIVRVIRRGAEATLIVASPIGLLPLQVKFAGTALTGELKLPFGPRQIEMTISGKK